MWTFLTQHIVAKLHEMDILHDFSGHNIANQFAQKRLDHVRILNCVLGVMYIFLQDPIQAIIKTLARFL